MSAAGGEQAKSFGGKLRLSVVTPERSVYEGAVDAVVVPGHDGEVAFFPGHAPYVGLLGVGELRFHAAAGGTQHHLLAGGVVQVVDDTVSVLAETVLPVAGLSVDKARTVLEAARALPATDDASEAVRAHAQLVARGKLRLATRAGAAAH